MSVETARDDFIQDLLDSGYWKASEISACDYSILDTCNTCAIMVGPGNGTWDIQAYGGDIGGDFELEAEGYIREAEDPREAKKRVWEFIRDFYTAITGGSNLTADPNRMAWPASYDAPKHVTVMFGGHSFIPVNCTVRVQE